jgi:ribosomal protein L11
MRSAKMICVTVEIREGAITRQVRVTAPSITRALRIAGDGMPGHRVRLVFPIDPEAFFVLEITTTGRLPEMERVDGSPGRDSVGSITEEQLGSTAGTKMPNLNTSSVETVMRLAVATAHSKGIRVST